MYLQAHVLQYFKVMRERFQKSLLILKEVKSWQQAAIGHAKFGQLKQAH
jgi:hypothetical protein